MREFDVKTEDARYQENEKDVGLHDARQKSLTRGHLHGHDVWITQIDAGFGTVKSLDRLSVKFRKQILGRIGNKIDELVIQRFRFGESLAIRDRRFRNLHVSAALSGVAAQEGCSIVENLFLERLVNIQRHASNSNQRRWRTGVRPRSHSRHI